MQEQKIEINAIVELFGHSRMAGKVTEQTIAGASFIRMAESISAKPIVDWSVIRDMLLWRGLI